MAKVLIVDDHVDNRVIARSVLEHSGHDVVEAKNGADGIRLARSGTPDLIIMDVKMPVLDGLEATRRLKADPQTSDIPVLIFTARALPSDRASAFAAGADAYLAMPCSPLAVVDEVERLTSQRA